MMMCTFLLKIYLFFSVCMWWWPIILLMLGKEVLSSDVEIRMNDDDASEIRDMSLKRRTRNTDYGFHYNTTPFSIEFTEESLVKFIYFNYTRIGEDGSKFGNNFVVFDPGKKALTDLAPCSLYSVFGEMKNLITNRTFNHTELISTDYAPPVTTILPVIPFEESIELQWNTSNRECVSKYLIRVSGDDFHESYESNATRLDWSIDGLSPCTEYRIEIETVNVLGETVSSVEMKEETSFMDPSSVEDLQVEIDETGRALVSWQPPLYGFQCVTDYTMKLAEDSCLDDEDQSCMWRYKNTNKSLHGVFEDLNSCTKYTLVLYTNGQEDGSNSSQTFDTDFHAPGTVEDLNVTVVNATSVKLQWSQPSLHPECVHHYHINWDNNNENSLTTVDTEVLLTDLEPCKTYMLSVSVVDIHENYSHPQIEQVTMPKDIPGVVQNVKLTPSSAELHVSWERPTYASHCVGNYTMMKIEDGVDDVKIFTSEYSHTFYEMTSCRRVYIEIYAEVSGFNASLPYAKNVRIPARVTVAPSSLQLVTRSKNILELKATLRESNIDCNLSKGMFTCKAENRDNDSNLQLVREFYASVPPLIDGYTEFTALAEHLPPYTSFNCTVRVLTSAGWSEPATGLFQTEEDYPSEPQDLREVDSSSNGFHVKWNSPRYPNGQVNSYRVEIQQFESLFLIPKSCAPAPFVNVTFETHESMYTYDKADSSYSYFVQVAAHNGAGVGIYTRPIIVKTLPSVPENVSQFAIQSVNGPLTPYTYNASVTLEWTVPCRSNGALQSFEGLLIGERPPHHPSKEQHIHNWEYPVKGPVRDNYSFTVHDLRPEHHYRALLRVRVKDVENASAYIIKEFDSPAGIPDTYKIENWASIDINSSPNPTRSAEVAISSEILDSKMGDVVSVALLVSEHGCQDDPDPEFKALTNGTDVPKLLTWSEARQSSCVPQYQTTPLRWRPTEDSFRDFGSSFVYTIGREDCELSEDYCNGHLKADTEYSLIIRIFTRYGFSDSAVLHFKTDALVSLITIVGLVTGCLLTAFIVGLLIARKNNSLPTWNPDDLRNRDETVPDVELKKFSDHYIDLMKNGKENLTKEFKLLNAVTLERDFSMAAAKHNETKNRYVNIIPYDMNRVLLSPEQGETEYINASYISGFKHSKEYIATQGPKLETCFDFWRMILQCNVKRIVMLTQLREDEKVKCYGYYPVSNLRSKSIQFKDIHIFLESESEFPIYRKRVFIVKRGELTKKVSHYHFTKWPDHGCPQNPTDLIEFTRMYQVEKKHSSSPTVVHCSAGVGRTGTFIALDIIMQTIRNRKFINIYEIVRQLRDERMKMVQTFHQYCLLYQCSYILVNKTSSMRWSRKSLLSRRLSSIQQTASNSNSSIQTIGEEIPSITINNSSSREKLSLAPHSDSIL